jgi:YesN/AraC family two-component response regulator
VENEKIYLDENISLQSLAENLNIQPYQLSQLLNEKLNQNFSDFINYHRIQEAKKILAGPKGAEKKNTAVAFDVGFNSMTAFYKAFKKFAGMTPNRYKKENHKGK